MSSREKTKLYELPETLAHLEPSNEVEAKAGPQCLAFNEAVLIGYEMNDQEKYRNVKALTDCLVCHISAESFLDALHNHHREMKRFKLLAAARYKEWERCGIHKLTTLEVFSNCSREFLADLAQETVPRLCFSGTDLMEEAQDGLVLLMSGIAVSDQKRRFRAPDVVSSFPWLGEETPGVAAKVKAKGVCQVLTLERSKLLRLLGTYPHQTALIVAEANKINARKAPNATKGARNARVAKKGEEPGRLFWYFPFCENLGALFLSELINSMEHFKLIPGQHLFRLHNSSADFMVVMMKGKVKAGEKVLDAPRVVCGFDRSGYVETIAEELCDVYCMNFERCHHLVGLCPDEIRTFLTRVQRFQERLEFRQGKEWFSDSEVLLRHDPFAACPEHFLKGCSTFMQVRYVLPGEVIVQEGDVVDHAVILAMGTARIHRQTRAGLRGCPDRTGEVEDSYLVGSISGAFRFAGMQQRLATIHAITLCKVVELKINGILGLLDKYPDACQKFREIAEKRFKELAPEPLEEHPFFKGFSKSFLNTLRTKCNSQVFFTGETIIKQGDTAESMIIISPSSVVTLFVDARKLKDLHGGCTLGVQSILSAKPAKRFATIVAMNACVVQKLTRKDWLDTLKSHAEHRFWIGDFVKEQLQVANEQAQETIRKYRWQKIKEREGAAMKLHRERTLSRYRPKPPSPSSVQPEGGPAVNLVEEEEDEVERWPCFNGQEAVVPHTRLPTLVPCIEAREDEEPVAPVRSALRRMSDVAKSLRFTRGSGQRRSVLGELPQLDNMPTISHNSWLDAQDAFGLIQLPDESSGA
ncbi:Potassium/sodium hyperpolarization-activated cyclic nucleotide-gated channel 4 [Durusdinium trenchii]|uniref:Potassium/sodium hyperpolarization-activated cyclic nucleotide-gated channel 4 n=1 Tax=Durusdinium trenchii TaxID=1381693 RepID=A0ABP0MQN3_9DINO